jgi:uncharacterized protein
MTKIETPLFVTISGSHLYGFSSADSDVDLRGAHAVDTDVLLSLDGNSDETIEIVAGVDDIVSHEVGKYFRLLLKNSGYCLEQVLSPLVVLRTPWFDELRALAPRLATKRHTRHYLGFTNRQSSLLLRRPDKEVKIILYIFRVLMTGITFAETGVIEANILRLNEQFGFAFVDELVREKIEGYEHSRLAGGHTLAFYIDQAERLRARLETAIAASALPETTEPGARAELGDLLLRIRRHYYRIGSSR